MFEFWGFEWPYLHFCNNMRYITISWTAAAAALLAAALWLFSLLCCLCWLLARRCMYETKMDFGKIGKVIGCWFFTDSLFISIPYICSLLFKCSIFQRFDPISQLFHHSHTLSEELQESDGYGSRRSSQLQQWKALLYHRIDEADCCPKYVQQLGNPVTIRRNMKTKATMIVYDELPISLFQDEIEIQNKICKKIWFWQTSTAKISWHYHIIKLP